jgi:diaminopimelate decarboxylase
MNLQTLALHYPTPFFAYNSATILDRVRELTTAFEGMPVSLYYAVKANDNPAVIQLVAEQGLGGCLVSEGEMKRALAGGIPASRLLMNGVGKSEEEIVYAIRHGIGQLNIESLPELHVVGRIATELGVQIPICLRLNPEIMARAHHYTTTARREDKFGVLVEDIPKAREIISEYSALDWRGFSCHIGSQIHGTQELEVSYRALMEIYMEEKKLQPQFDRLDLGGGFGVSYRGDAYARPADYAGLLRPLMAEILDDETTVQLEPGRFIVAEAGELITKVLFVKYNGDVRFLVVDAAMNNLLRPALYGAYHPIQVVRSSAAGLSPATIVGPVCESADVFSVDYHLPSDIVAGDYLAIGCAGAYGMAMSSQYNARPRLAEIMAEGDSHRVIRRAFTAEEYDSLTLVG